jgi:hypothetical protein
MAKVTKVLEGEEKFWCCIPREDLKFGCYKRKSNFFGCYTGNFYIGLFRLFGFCSVLCRAETDVDTEHRSGENKNRNPARFGFFFRFRLKSAHPIYSSAPAFFP